MALSEPEDGGRRERRAADAVKARRAGLEQMLTALGQEHLLAFFGELAAAERESLLAEIERLNFEQLRNLFESVDSAATWRAADVEPAAVIGLPQTVDEELNWRKARAIGEEALRAGHVAALLVAGGQGSRLGYDGPKGAFAIGPVSGKSLFQIHAEKVLATSRRYKAPMPLVVMTGPENDAVTRQFFADRQFFGLSADQVLFFCQGQMPAVDKSSGRLLLAEKHRLALSPDGHGGVIAALVQSGTLDELDRRGIRHLFYFQVDNPLVAVADPTMVGHHLLAGAEFSLKVIRKIGPLERVGNVVDCAGQTMVIEYAELPDELAHKKTAAGELAIWAGNMGVHLFDVGFVRRIARGDELPFHRAVKKTPFIDEAGKRIEPATPNAFKFERFIFDAFPLARKAVPIEVDRAEEFEPVKNAEGENSPDSARQAMTHLYARWLGRAGVDVPRDRGGQVAVPIEIGPLFALDADELAARALDKIDWSKPVLLDHLA